MFKDLTLPEIYSETVVLEPFDRVLPINGPGPMALSPNGTVVLSSRACLSQIPEYEFDRVFN